MPDISRPVAAIDPELQVRGGMWGYHSFRRGHLIVGTEGLGVEDADRRVALIGECDVALRRVEGVYLGNLAIFHDQMRWNRLRRGSDTAKQKRN
jgi:hypothetical protein